MLNKISVFGLLITTLLVNTVSYSQLPVPFKVRYQSYIKGDMTVIANNIVNRKDKDSEPNIPYMNTTKTAKLNDEFDMYYIDIDNERSTFSSSTATLNFDDFKTKKIVYAGLYWSATYRYNIGTKNKRNKFKAFDKNREAFDKIKLKLPGRQFYQNVAGEIIFDGLNQKDFKENAPYTVYADITNLVQDLDNPTGDYTVANIRATQGSIEGGVAGGWTIFFVFEDENSSGKFITSFDGFAGVTDEETTILYTGFKTLPQGNVNFKLACAGLEGDNNLSGDQLQIKSEFSDIVTLLSNSLMPENNYFNSSVIIEDSYFTNRNPNSNNTLGYDTSLITIHNPDNSVIQNNTSNVALKIKTVGDRFYMFFNAFNVEVVEPESQEPLLVENEESYNSASANSDENSLKSNETNVNQEDIITIEKTKNTLVEETKQPVIETKIETKKVEVITEIKPSKIVNNQTITSKKEETIVQNEPINTFSNQTITPKKEETIIQNQPFKTVSSQIIVPIKEAIVDHPKIEKEAALAQNSENSTIDPILISEQMSLASQNQMGNKKRVTAIPGPMVEISNQQQGFYVIANVFAIHKNATRFVDKLRTMGIDAGFFINPKNNYRYVFVSKHDSWSNALGLYYSNINGKYYGDTWIMLVNTTPDQLVENNKPTIRSQNSSFLEPTLMAIKNEEEFV